MSKLVLFSDNSPEMEDVQEQLNNGWIITSLIQNQRHQYVGIIEKHDSRELSLISKKKRFILLG
jgi:hypothetical protein